jgi:hypothetical protein
MGWLSDYLTDPVKTFASLSPPEKEEEEKKFSLSDYMTEGFDFKAANERNLLSRIKPEGNVLPTVGPDAVGPLDVETEATHLDRIKSLKDTAIPDLKSSLWTIGASHLDQDKAALGGEAMPGAILDKLVYGAMGKEPPQRPTIQDQMPWLTDKIDAVSDMMTEKALAEKAKADPHRLEGPGALGAYREGGVSGLLGEGITSALESAPSTALPMAAAAVNPIAGPAAMWGQEAGAFEQGGGSPGMSAVVGAASGALEYAGLRGALGAGRKGVASWLARLGAVAGGSQIEGATEAAQEAITLAGETAEGRTPLAAMLDAGDMDGAWNEVQSFVKGRGFDSYLAGATMGAGIAGAGQAVNAALEPKREAARAAANEAAFNQQFQQKQAEVLAQQEMGKGRAIAELTGQEIGLGPLTEAEQRGYELERIKRAEEKRLFDEEAAKNAEAQEALDRAAYLQDLAAAEELQGQRADAAFSRQPEVRAADVAAHKQAVKEWEERRAEVEAAGGLRGEGMIFDEPKPVFPYKPKPVQETPAYPAEPTPVAPEPWVPAALPETEVASAPQDGLGIVNAAVNGALGFTEHLPRGPRDFAEDPEIRDWMQKNLTSQGAKPKEWGAADDIASGKINVEKEKSNRIFADYQDALFAYGQKAGLGREELGKVSEQIYTNFMTSEGSPEFKALATVESIGLPSTPESKALLKGAKVMRRHIDEWSTKLRESGILTPEQIATFDSNMGEYVHRAYRAFGKRRASAFRSKLIGRSHEDRVRWDRSKFNEFDTPKWVPKPLAKVLAKIGVEVTVESQAWKAAQQKMWEDRGLEIQDRLRRKWGDVSEETLNKLTISRINAELSSMVDREGDTMFGSREDSLGKDARKEILSRRKDIAPEYRKIMGEITEAGESYQDTIASMVSTYERTKMYEKLVETGMGKYFFPDKMELPDGTKFDKQIGTQGHGPLGGLYTTKDLHEVIVGADIAKQENLLWTSILAANSLIKVGKTIYSPVTHVRNFNANMGFLMAQGHSPLDLIRPGKSKAYRQALKMSTKGVLLADIFGGGRTSDVNLQSTLDRMHELGVLGESARAGEVKAHREDLKALISGSGWEGPRIMRGYAKGKWASKAMKVLDPDLLHKMYRAEDNFWKATAFQLETGRLVKLGASQQAAEEYAAWVVKNTMPNYDKVPRFVKNLRRNILVSSFPSYYAESWRNIKNSAMLTAHELGLIKWDKAPKSPFDGKDAALDAKKTKVGLGLERALGHVQLAALNSAYFGLVVKTVVGLIPGLVGEKEKEAVSDKKMVVAARKHLDALVPYWSKDAVLVPIAIDNGKTVRYIDMSYMMAHGAQSRVMNAVWDATKEGFSGDVEKMIDKAIDAAKVGTEPFHTLEIGTSAVEDLYRNQDQYGRQIVSERATGKDALVKRGKYLSDRVLPGFIDQGSKVTDPKRDRKTELMAVATGMRLSTIDLAEAAKYIGQEYNRQDDPENEKTTENAYQHMKVQVEALRFFGTSWPVIRKEMKINSAVENRLQKEIK